MSEIDENQDTPAGEAQQVAERSLLGLLANDVNTVAVTTVASALGTAAGLAVKNAMDRHGQAGDGKSGSGEGGGEEPRATA